MLLGIAKKNCSSVEVDRHIVEALVLLGGHDNLFRVALLLAVLGADDLSIA